MQSIHPSIHQNVIYPISHPSGFLPMLISRPLHQPHTFRPPTKLGYSLLTGTKIYQCEGLNECLDRFSLCMLVIDICLVGTVVYDPNQKGHWVTKAKTINGQSYTCGGVMTLNVFRSQIVGMQECQPQSIGLGLTFQKGLETPAVHKHARQSDRGSNQPIGQSAVQAQG